MDGVKNTDTQSIQESDEVAILTPWDDIMKSFDDIYELSKGEDKNVNRY